METIKNFILSNGLRFVAMCFIAFCIIGLITVLLVFLYKKKQDNDIDSYTIFHQDRDLNLCRAKAFDTGKRNHKIFNNVDIKDVIKDGASSLSKSSFDFRGVDFDTE